MPVPKSLWLVSLIFVLPNKQKNESVPEKNVNVNYEGESVYRCTLERIKRLIIILNMANPLLLT